MKIKEKRLLEMLHLLDYLNRGEVLDKEEFEEDFCNWRPEGSIRDAAKALNIYPLFETFRKSRKLGYIAGANIFVAHYSSVIRKIMETEVPVESLKTTKDILAAYNIKLMEPSWTVGDKGFYGEGQDPTPTQYKIIEDVKKGGNRKVSIPKKQVNLGENTHHEESYLKQKSHEIDPRQLGYRTLRKSEGTVVGFTGGSGTGKSTASKALGDLGYTVIDVDLVYKGLLEGNQELCKELISEFGTSIRSELEQEVFENKGRLKKLNYIIFKYIVPAVKELINGNTIIDAAILFDAKLDKLCDITVAFNADNPTRIERIMARDNITKEQAESRVMAQNPNKRFMDRVDFYIDSGINSGESLKRQTLKIVTPNTVAIYGGTFDPGTLGHYDVICRAAKLFDRLHVVILDNPNKNPMFTINERLEMLKLMTMELPNVTVDSFKGLLAEYAVKKGAKYSVRGVRNGFDLEYERTMFELNSEIARIEFEQPLETVFLPTARENMNTSSSNVKELLKSGAKRVAATYLTKEVARLIFNRENNI